MITIMDWIATIPEEDRHLAYVGEHQAVTRQFLLTGEGWQNYADWGFHLDMAFDLSTVTTRETRQLENTKVESSETVSDTLVKTTANTQKEKYTTNDVTVDCHSATDIASLQKQVGEEGILLTWKVLRQHTQLPGRLWANIRALGQNGEVKKSSVMVFDVGASVDAEQAADLPQSEMEAMEERMDSMLNTVLQNAQTVSDKTADVKYYVKEAKSYAEQAQAAYINADNIRFDVDEQVTDIRRQMQTVANENATQTTAISGLSYELLDMRTAYQGSRYDSAGDAVRSQVGAAMMDIGRLTSRVATLEEQVAQLQSALANQS